MTECEGLQGPPGPSLSEILQLVRDKKLTDTEFAWMVDSVKWTEERMEKYKAIATAAADVYDQAIGYVTEKKIHEAGGAEPSKLTAAPWKRLKETLNALG